MKQIISLVFSFLLVGNLAFAQNVPWYKRVFLKKKSVTPIERWDLRQDSKRDLRQRDFLRAQLDSFFYYYFNQAVAPTPTETVATPGTIYPEATPIPTANTTISQPTTINVTFNGGLGEAIFSPIENLFSSGCSSSLCFAMYNNPPPSLVKITLVKFSYSSFNWDGDGGAKDCKGLTCTITIEKTGVPYSITVKFDAPIAMAYVPYGAGGQVSGFKWPAATTVNMTDALLTLQGKYGNNLTSEIVYRLMGMPILDVINKIPDLSATGSINDSIKDLLINKNLTPNIVSFMRLLMDFLASGQPRTSHEANAERFTFEITAEILNDLYRLLSQPNFNEKEKDIDDFLRKSLQKGFTLDNLEDIKNKIKEFIDILVESAKPKDISTVPEEPLSISKKEKEFEVTTPTLTFVEVKPSNKINLAAVIRATMVRFVNTAIEKLGLQGLLFREKVKILKESPLFQPSPPTRPPQPSSIENARFLAQVIVGREKLLVQKSTYQDKFWKNYNSIGEIVDKAIPSSLIYDGSDNSYRSESGVVKENLKSCLTRALDNKIGTSVLEDENEVFGYVLWFFDETIDSISRILKSDKPNNEKTEKVVNIVRGCQKLSNSVFASIKDYKDKILEIMNKDILVSAPTKATKALIDSIKITAYGDFSESAYGDLGKANNCNSLVNDKEVGSVEWTSTDKAGISDNQKAETSLNSGEISYWLKATDCKIPVPSSSKRITGFKVEIERTKSGSDVIKDLNVKMVKNGKTVGTGNTTSSDWTTSDLSVTYGSSTEAWGETWTAGDVKSSGFGVVIAVKNEGPKPAAVAASTQTTSQTATTQTTTPQATKTETPVQKMVKYLDTKSLKPGDTNEHVSTLQTEVLIKFKGKSNPAEALDTALKSGTKPGKYGNATAEAVFFLKQILASWAEKNKKTEDENFAAVIKEVKSVTVKKAVFSQEFTLKTWKAFLDYVKGVSAK